MSSSSGYEDLPFVAEFYDYVVPYRERGDVNFFVEAARASGGPVLEIRRGTGREVLRRAEPRTTFHHARRAKGAATASHSGARFLPSDPGRGAHLPDQLSGRARGAARAPLYNAVPLPF